MNEFIENHIRACIEVLHVFVSCVTLFTSFYMMHVKLCMHENLTAANSYKIFPCNCHSISAKPTGIKKKDIPGTSEKVEETVSKL